MPCIDETNAASVVIITEKKKSLSGVLYLKTFEQI